MNRGTVRRGVSDQETQLLAQSQLSSSAIWIENDRGIWPPEYVAAAATNDAGAALEKPPKRKSGLSRFGHLMGSRV